MIFIQAGKIEQRYALLDMAMLEINENQSLGISIDNKYQVLENMCVFKMHLPERGHISYAAEHAILEQYEEEYDYEKKIRTCTVHLKKEVQCEELNTGVFIAK